MSVLLTAEGLGKEHGGRKSLRDVSFCLEAGQHLVVFGSNGAGKTTLLRLLALLDKPSSGTVAYAAPEKLDEEAARARIGLVTHAPQLYLDLSAEENLMLFARLYGVGNAQERVSELLEQVDLLHRRTDTVRGFSRGMTQRLAIARALVHDPDVLLLDEVYSGLDPRGAELIRAVLLQGADRRIVVEVSHSFEQGYADATDLLFLARGRAAALLSKEAADYTSMHAHYEQVLQGRPA